MRLRALHSVAWIKRFTPENFLSKNDFSLRARRWQKGGSRRKRSHSVLNYLPQTGRSPHKLELVGVLSAARDFSQQTV
jgi:hypothetical protein